MKEKRTPSLAYSLLTLFSLAIFLVVGMRVWGGTIECYDVSRMDVVESISAGAWIHLFRT